MVAKTLISSTQAAKMLNVSLRTVQLWVEKGVLTAWKTPGGHRRISLTSVQELLDQQAIQAGFTTSKVQLLVVEDDANQRKLLSKFFQRWELPLEVHVAEDGYQGLMMVGEIKPDLLITDLMMPSMDGVQMINAIRSRKELDDARIIVITAMDADSDAVTRLRKDGIAVLQKPVLFEQLKELVTEKVAQATGTPLSALRES